MVSWKTKEGRIRVLMPSVPVPDSRVITDDGLRVLEEIKPRCQGQMIVLDGLYPDVVEFELEADAKLMEEVRL